MEDFTSGSGAARSVLIIGAGPAGFSAAAELRRRGFDGTIDLIDPSGEAYDRPPLSKAYLAGTLDRGALALAGPDWFQENSVRITAGTAERIAPDSGTVTLDGGALLHADALLLATGGTARKPLFPGASLVHTLRNRDDADALRATLGPGKRLAVIGAGLIGAEVASTAVSLGSAVVLIDPVPVPLVPAFGPELAAHLHGMHAAAGVETRTGLPVDVMEEDEGLAVLMDDGSLTVADAVLAAVGMEPDTALAEAAGIRVDGGVLVDARGRTSHPRVFAAGDAVRRTTAGMPERRNEHWDAAVRSGQAAAAGILGQEPEADAVPWFWTDRYGVHAEAVGSLNGKGTTVRRGIPGPGYVVFQISPAGALAGAAGIDAGQELRAARRLIALGAPVDPLELADPATDLRRLARSRR
ncbi:NAD(P)/FAD-dependent oxidoreductase [Arthrobacter caoxuetaonis]|uniref:FAD-dependent oxidoreductase n=1 Tax=Arthrobacter caoxuetaonis TaxID=2886935 RepID=A0A9X1MAG8_9MICC|nr:FAD-dependent oxidoreductase [Arthrobacter caoxuetaonis]MCC3296228.1 FAD-dependent oxidoreductase [Arthrobacter caoxuetaonis]USQ56917.1 FAD-dependent oxidoreductase [Arthrobacter caoxuetaonis]